MHIKTSLLRSILVAGAAASFAVAQTSPANSGSQRTPNTGTTTERGATPGNAPGTTGTSGTAGTAGAAGAGMTGSGRMTTTEHQSHVAGAAGNSESGASMIGKPDSEFLKDAAMGGMTEVQLAQMAQQKASSQEVKDYARKLEQDHTKANEELKTIAQQRQVSLPSDIGPQHQAMVSKLNGLSGAEFDRAYITMMVKDHRKDIKEFEREANRGMDSDLKNFASSTLPTLREHLQTAEQINGSTRSRKADKSSGKASHDAAAAPSSGSATPASK